LGPTQHPIKWVKSFFSRDKAAGAWICVKLHLHYTQHGFMAWIRTLLPFYRKTFCKSCGTRWRHFLFL